jgi:UDP-N-acetylglucosamine 4,6-dehydratase
MSGLSGTILITGGTGTLGHAIVRTAERENWPCTLTIYSRSELRQAQMRARHPHLRFVLGDVRDYERLAAAVVGHDLVIHAAAMKRIPDCEAQPAECFSTNVQGSANVVGACIQHGVKRCVGISTDKACRAVTAYGASKLAMEKLFQAQPAAPTIFTLVRYGNVVASNGSVIPLWREQARHDGVVTITNPKMTRFWLAPSDAVASLVHAAKDVAGVIRVPKLPALSITEMAQIIAPGARQHVIGVRSAEKKHEDLVAPDETASDCSGFYLLHHAGGSTGYTYTSDTAPRLSREQFLEMLEEAESYD